MGKIRVVIVDDNNDFCVAISEVIKLAKELDMELAGIARNGSDACKMIIGKQPDLVLLDNVMPELDGIGVVETVNEANLENPPKIISYTSMCSEDFVRAMFHLGVSYCMNKETDVYQILLRGQMLVNNTRLCRPSMEYLKGKATPVEEFPDKAAEILQKLGVPANLKGYEYLIEAICVVAENKDALKGITKRVYPLVAKTFDTDRTNVERAIRHAIKLAWERGDRDVFADFFRFSSEKKPKKPTNSEFVATIAQYVRGR